MREFSETEKNEVAENNESKETREDYSEAEGRWSEKPENTEQFEADDGDDESKGEDGEKRTWKDRVFDSWKDLFKKTDDSKESEQVENSSDSPAESREEPKSRREEFLERIKVDYPINPEVRSPDSEKKNDTSDDGGEQRERVYEKTPWPEERER